MQSVRSSRSFSRAGVGHLTLIDADILRPGNCIRHLLGDAHLGQPKVCGVRDELSGHRSLDTVVDPRRERLSTATQAADLLESHDVVVDATASVTTRLLLDAGATLEVPVISACLLRDGQVTRIDRVPLLPGEAHAPATPPLTEPRRAAYESGCGDPVSPTPMWAVSTAASRAAGAAIDILTGRCQYPASIVDVLVAGTDACLTIGTS